MTCYESTQEKLEETLEGNVGEEMVQFDPFDKIKEESMLDPGKEKKKRIKMIKTSSVDMMLYSLKAQPRKSALVTWLLRISINLQTY